MAKNKKFDVEHALSMYAYSFYYLSAKSIYDDEVVATLGDAIEKCHIYVIGFVPLVEILSMKQDHRVLIVAVKSLGVTHELHLQMPEGVDLAEDDGAWYFAAQDGSKYDIDRGTLMYGLHTNTDGLLFDVQYVGQAYGADGSRNALDRLKKHETLQKISLQGVPDGHDLVVLMLEIQPANQIISVFNLCVANSYFSHNSGQSHSLVMRNRLVTIPASCAILPSYSFI